MIISGVLLLAYPVGTWGYTWFAQRELRQQLETGSPQIKAAAAALGAADFTPVTSLGEQNQPDPLAEAAAEYQAKVAAFKAAADAFAASADGEVGEPIGKVVIPGVGVDVVMLEGAEKSDLREGPGHWPETPFPGQGGNFVLSGYRTTYLAPFRKLDKVKVGDEIYLVLPYVVARYTVTRVVIISPTEMEQVSQLGREQVSLAACHPLYSARQRILVQGDLTSFKLIESRG
jgi:sortase A